jgi:formate hydrogenlyase subunit 3/multisubunit Na+/H+ antiporter MnhD subunit
MTTRQKLIESQERLGATRQCCVCLAGVAILNGFAAILLAYNAMTFLWGCVWVVGALAFSAVAAFCVLISEHQLQERRDMGSHGSAFEGAHQEEM